MTVKIDIPLILGRLCPTAEYHWKANGWGTYEDIGQWRTPEIPKPSEAAIYAEWERYQFENNLFQETLKNLSKSVVNTEMNDMDAITMRDCLMLILIKLRATTPDGKIKPFAEWG